MAKQQIDPERDLRAWADALGAVADLQHAIVEQAREMTLIDFEGQKWLEPYRAIVFGTLQTFPERAKDTNHLEAAEGLKRTATEALAILREEALVRPK